MEARIGMEAGREERKDGGGKRRKEILRKEERMLRRREDGACKKADRHRNTWMKGGYATKKRG
jgi:hypothetical protein